MKQISLHALVAWFALTLTVAGQEVVINEIMYHPASQDAREEYIELFNAGAMNANLTGWKLVGGVDFNFPSNTTLNAGAYLVVSARKVSFLAKYPSVPAARVLGDWLVIRTTNLVGNTITNYQNTLSNTRNTIDLRNAADDLVDTVSYADEGDWAIRQRGPDDLGHRGWIWNKEHDGFGKSLELINPALPNDYGQNWAASVTTEGTPGTVNSVSAANIAPMLVEVLHQPAVPRSVDPITITCRALNESPSGVTVRLQWRVDAAVPPPFTTNAMFDDGLHNDGLAGDGIYGVTIAAQANDAVIEYFVHARDAQGNERTWPGPAIGAPDDGSGPTGQAANALLQVDDNAQNVFGAAATIQPVFKMIFTENERAELAGIPCTGSQNSDAQMNTTFVSLDASGAAVLHRCGVRNRGNSSRCSSPPNYRVNFVSERPWKNLLALNLNTRQVHLQVFGNALVNKSGAAGAYSQAAQVRVNNQNLAASGAPMFGAYAANEAYTSDWADRHFPSDGGGNVYKAVRNINPSAFEYRGLDANNYRHTYFKDTNVSEDDWMDMMTMLSVMGVPFSGLGQPNPVPFNEQTVRQVINVEQWLIHTACMSLVGNSESGINSGHNDDYYLYRGVNDPRFILLYHDMDQLFAIGGQPYPFNDTIWGATSQPPPGAGRPGTGDDEGVGLTFQQLLRSPEFEPLYYRTLQDLIDTTFSAAQFDSLVDQTLGGWVTPNTINTIKNYMNQRRAYVQGLIDGLAPPKAGVAALSGEPRSPTFDRNATLTVGGDGITHYRYRLNNGAWGPETPAGTAIALSNLPNNSTNIVQVVGRNANNVWQSTNSPTVSKTWVVNTSWPAIRLSEVLARNGSAVDHQGTFPDVIELQNEGSAPIDLSGMRLTDDAADANKFVFPAGTTLAAGAYLVLYANNSDGTPGVHLGFGLNQDGDGVYLFERVASGGALLDSVEFGAQLADLSIGRPGSGGTWLLGQATPGAANTAQSLGSPRNLKINEWLASGQGVFADDFIELFNPDAQPVDAGGLFLTDLPIGAPARHRVPELTFITAGGMLAIIADGDDAEPGHAGFSLDSDVGEIALFTAHRALIDCLSYGSQSPGVSMGRCPDGAAAIKSLVLPTAGGGNACPVPPPTAQGVTLMAVTNIWKYVDTGVDLGTAWRAPAYDDSAWPEGPGLLGRLRSGGVLPEPVNTQLIISNTRTTFYFRAHFNLPANHNLAAIQLSHIIDDGAVFYLNGNALFSYNMPGGPIVSTTLAAQNILDAEYQGPVNVPLNSFQIGDNVFAVEVHQGNPGSADINFAMMLTGVSATNNPADAGVVLNEIFANNATQAEPDGSTPDWVELYNPSANAVDLAGMSLADSGGNRWIFPSGSVMAGTGWFQVRFDADRPASVTNTGFGLKASGDVLTLYNKAPNTNTPINTRSFGLLPADFSVGRMPDGGTNWTLTQPTIGSANFAATLGSVSQIRINEWLADPQPGEDDWFELYNPNPQPVDISFCYLNDSSTTHRLPALCFIGAVTNAWQTFIADNNVSAGADHVPFRLGASSDSIGLASASGVPIDSITFTAQVADVSEGRLPDGAAAVLKFPGTKSPGDANFVGLTNMVVNEVLTHTDPPREDAIELFNPTAASVNVGGWWLSDSRGVPRKYQIPANTPAVPAGGFLVVYEDQFNSSEQALVPFALSSAEGDEVYLSAGNTNGVMNGYRTSADFGPAANGVSFGRYRTSVGSDFPAMSQHTFGVDNPATLAQFRTGTGGTNAYPKVGAVIISEIMYHPTNIILAGVTNDNVIEEFVELRNTSSGAVSLYDPAYPTNGWRLRDAVDFRFNFAHTIPAGGHLIVVSFDPATNLAALAQFRSRYGSNLLLAGPYSGKLDNGGESVELVRPDTPQTNGSVPQILVEKVVYQDRGLWPTNADGLGLSLQRLSASGYANDPTNWFAALPAPESSGVTDSDGDGMPDDWEMTNGLDKNNPADANQDADGDGLNNLQEYLAGTNPGSAASSLRLTSALNGDMTELRFQAVAGKTYSMLYCDSLPGPAIWQWLRNIPAQGSDQTVVIEDSTGGVQRFYRVVTPARP